MLPFKRAFVANKCKARWGKNANKWQMFKISVLPPALLPKQDRFLVIGLILITFPVWRYPGLEVIGEIKWAFFVI